MNTFFWVLWTIVAIGALVFFYFFFIGLVDGSVSSFNAGIWTVVVILFPALLAGTYWLKLHGWLKLAVGLLSIPAIPMIGYLLFLIAVLISGPIKWN